MNVDHQVVIVGAGFGGMGAAIALQRAGVEDYVILERADDLGGTWYVNHYPGLTVDIPSATYSYSFEPNPNWSHVFARGHELKAYCDQVATKHELRSHMRFGVTVASARWDDDASVWVVALADGSTLTTQQLITATGFLSEPAMPEIAGVETFAGTVVHTAEWDDGLDLAGRRVAVIGTGATSVQLVPTIALDVAELTVFQRTPIWVFPKLDQRISERTQRLFQRLPVTQRASRFAGWAFVEALLVFGVLHYRQFGLSNAMAAETRDEATSTSGEGSGVAPQKLTPSYTFGCKRPTVSNNYFPTFTKPHVHLETSPIERIESDAIVTADGVRHEIDTLVLATGYNLWESRLPAVRDHRQGRPQPRQVVARGGLPVLPRFVDSQVPEPADARRAMGVFGSFLLPDTRTPDDDHRAAVRRTQADEEQPVGGQGISARRVPEPDAEGPALHRLPKRQLRRLSQLLLHPQRGDAALAHDVDHQHYAGGEELSAQQLHLRLTPAQTAPARSDSTAWAAL